MAQVKIKGRSFRPFTDKKYKQHKKKPEAIAADPPLKEI